jgi:hypothetical protein
MLKSITLQSLNIFRIREGSKPELQNLRSF